jgi:hypothetical protein
MLQLQIQDHFDYLFRAQMHHGDVAIWNPAHMPHFVPLDGVILSFVCLGMPRLSKDWLDPNP